MAIVLSVLRFIASDYLPLVSCGHCIVCPSIYSFWLSLWYPQTFLRFCQIKVLKPGMKLAMHWSSVKLFQIKLTKPDTKLAMYCSKVRLFQNKLTKPDTKLAMYCSTVRLFQIKRHKPVMKLAMYCSTVKLFQNKLAIWNMQWIAYKIDPAQRTQACNEISNALLIRQTDPVQTPKPGMEIAMDCSWDSMFLIKLTKA